MIMIVPEFILQQTIQSMLDYIRQDYIDNIATPTKSYLYKLLNGTAFKNYDFYEQAKQIVCSNPDDPRYLVVDLMFNMERNGAPTIHITLPGESGGQGDGLGSDEGYEDYIHDQDADVDNHVMAQDTPVYSRRMAATYNIVVSSDNTNEIIFLYHFTRAILIAVIPHLTFKGLENVVFGGRDIQPYPELANRFYMRAINLSLQYQASAPSKYPLEIPNDIVVDGTPIEDDNIS